MSSATFASAMALVISIVTEVSAFAPSGGILPRGSLTAGQCKRHPLLGLKMSEVRSERTARRRFLGRSASLALAGVTLAVGGHAEAQGLQSTPEVEWYRPPSVTDGNYTGLEWQGPVWKKPEGENSISYAEFLKALKAGELAYVDFVGYSGEKVYARFKATPNERIRVGEGLPDETTPPPKPALCQECEASCKPEDRTCSCLSACGGKKDWNSPIYLAKVVRRFKTEYRYSQDDNNAFGSVFNRARRFMMFDGPMSAGLI